MKNLIKKCSALLLIIMSILCLSGCIRYRADMEVKKNGKVDFEFIYAIYSSGSDDDDKIDDDDIEDLEDEGWEIDDYKKDSYEGYTFSISDVKLEDLEEKLDNDVFEDMGFKDFSLTKKGSTYTLDWDVDVGSGLSENDIDNDKLKDYNGYLEFNLTLPKKAIDHNATDESKDGTELSWDLTEEDEIYCEFKISNLTSVFIFIGIFFLILIAAVIVVFCVILPKKKNGNAPEVSAPVTPSVTPSSEPVTPSYTSDSSDENKEV